MFEPIEGHGLESSNPIPANITTPANVEVVTIKLVRQVPTGQYAYDQATVEGEVVLDGPDTVAETISAWQAQLDDVLPRPDKVRYGSSAGNSVDAMDFDDPRGGYPRKLRF